VKALKSKDEMHLMFTSETINFVVWKHYACMADNI